MGAIKKEHDRELTHKPILTPKSHIIARNKYKADLDKSLEAINDMAEKDEIAMQKSSITNGAKDTLRKKKRAVTPRIAVLYLDGAIR